ncbi:hypothetical protein ACQRET_20315 [Streptomyces koyangensis]|uniref:hypothetical protein n=1 Tax=Streptomyces koyangensis TaxID=188770 RepID=UPI0013C4F96C|nr:hypothetical protein [Streptomyces koyangensis]
MGSLGLAAILAVALAALRGTAGAITDWRQRRMAAAAEAAPLRAARAKLQASQMRADAADPSSGGGGRGRVPSSNDYGRRTLGGGGGGGRGTGGGTGRTSGGTGPSRRDNSTGFGGGRGSGPGKGPAPLSPGSSSGSGTGPSRSGSTGGGGGRRPGLLDQLTGRGRRGKGTGSSATGTGSGSGSGSGSTGGGKGRSGTGTSGAGSGSSTRSTGKGAGTGSSGSSSGSGTGTSQSSGAAGAERVTLGKSLGDEARRRAEERLRRRREDLDPPFLHRVPRDEKGADSTAPEEPETAANGPAEPGPSPGPSEAETGPHAAGTGSNDPGTGWEFYEPPGDNGRRDPWDSLFEAEWDAQVVWTVEQVDPPGAHARRWEPDAIAPARAGLPASTPPTATATAGATTPSMTKETRVSAPIPTPRAAGAASEHLTDVTLDDVLASLEKSKTDCFTTYDECASLAALAAELRDGLHALGTELKQRHNVIGRMTGAAMHRLGESMDLLVRKAEEMRTESLHAAEAIELAHDDMHDAYRPVQQATADAGLVMPSARIHNED